MTLHEVAAKLPAFQNSDISLSIPCGIGIKFINMRKGIGSFVTDEIIIKSF